MSNPTNSSARPGTELPEREFSERELRAYIGERGMPMYVAYDGVVYDVTRCPKWRRGIHENLHWLPSWDRDGFRGLFLGLGNAQIIPL